MKSDAQRPSVEDTIVRVKIRTAWFMITSVVLSAIWLTAYLTKIQHQNEDDHARLMISIAELNTKSDQWITARQFEDITIWIEGMQHSRDTNWTQERAMFMREGIRAHLKAPNK